MEFVLTLIAADTDQGLSRDLAAAAKAALAEAGAEVGAPDWLAPGLACDIAFDGLDLGRGEAAARERLRSAPIDLAVQRTEGRRKALLVADMESTIIGQEMLDELGDVLGLRDRIAEITGRAMAGELDFVAALQERVSLLKGLPASVLDQAARRMTRNPGAEQLIATLKAHGVATALVSGGFACFAEPVARHCGFDSWTANALEILDDRLTGRVAEPILDRDAKCETLLRLAAEHALPVDATCALGDGANDAAMLTAAGLGIAYRGKAIARAAADACIDHGDLTAALYMQGYRHHELSG